ncbi:hypothetical protein [Streptomyces sp. NPDC095602]|uniref:hypothetical protein n=1 Tax=Streptomyces sp. NPDC095602 TaxID=3155819 RepID=UPI003333BAD2
MTHRRDDLYDRYMRAYREHVEHAAGCSACRADQHRRCETGAGLFDAFSALQDEYLARLAGQQR